MKGIGGHHKPYRGKTDEWLTPPEIIKAIGPFDLDPCSPVDRPWDTASKHYTVADNGLSKPWFGNVWLNPPYGPHTGIWLRKLADHGIGIALVFARTETQMFHKWCWNRADAMFFLEGRLHFHHVNGERAKANAGGPSVLVAYGFGCSESLRTSGLPGFFVELRDGAV